MRTAFACLLLSLLAVAGHTAHAQALPLTPLDGFVAVVDEDVFLTSELKRATYNFLAQFAGRQPQLPPRDVLERQILVRPVLSRVQIVRANEMGIRINEAERSEVHT